MNSVYEIITSEDKLFSVDVCSDHDNDFREGGGGRRGAEDVCVGGGKINSDNTVACFSKFIKTFITCNSIKTKWFFTVLFLYSEKIYDNKHVR